jgi:archaellum component FlaC
MKVKISITTLLKIYNSNKDFILYRLNEDETRLVDFTLSNDLSRFRAKYNNKFKLVTDIKKQIKNFKIEL